MSDKRKTLTFRSADQSENTAYIFLDKIRYGQTKFITQLIMDFMKENGLDLTSPYEEIKNACSQYIEKGEVTTSYCEQSRKLQEIGDSLEEIKELLKSGEGVRVQIEPSEKEEPVQKEPEIIQQPSDEEEEFSNMLSSFKMMADA